MTSDLLSDLNDRQREAVETIDGPLLIVAGPGSGKTRFITSRIAYLMRVVGVSPGRIAAVTFTNKAAREMKTRVESVAGFGSERLTIGTFHAFCARMLRWDGEALGLDTNFGIYDDADQIDVIKRSMREVEVDPKAFSPRNIQSKISGAKSQLLTADGFAANTQDYFEEVVSRVYVRYEELMAQSNAVDFDDLLLKAYLLLARNEDVARKYQERFVHFMIDEFQDTNVAQYAIARLIAAKHRNLCVVGDPDQSIYSWRNADIRNILSFRKDFPDAKLIALEQNYRSTQNILDAAARLISVNTQRVEKELFTKNVTGAPISVMEGYDETEEAQLVLREVASLTRPVNGGKARYRLGDIAVMYRVNAQSRAFEESCMRHGVPYQLVGGMKFYQRQEVKDLAAYLKLVANPNDDVSLTRVINLPSRGIGRRTMDELTRLARDRGCSMFDAILAISPDSTLGGPLVSSPFTARAVRALGDFRNLIDELRTYAESANIVDLIDRVLTRSGYRDYLSGLDDRPDERLENIDEFKAASKDYLHLGPAEGLSAFLESVSLVSDVDSMEEKPDLLTLITLHQAKGLEYPIVFMVGMEDGLLPHSRSMDEPASLEEERRLCYVGMTRAKDRLYLSRAFRRGFRGGSGPNSPSRFLLDIPRELISQPGAPDRTLAGDSGRSEPLSRRPRRTGASEGFEFTRRSSDRFEPSDPSRPVASEGSESTRRRSSVTGSEESKRIKRSGRSAAPPTRRRTTRRPSPQTAPTYSIGDKVVHKAFGEGIVMSCEPSGADFELTVAFKDGGGVKRLLLSLAPLEKVE